MDTYAATHDDDCGEPTYDDWQDPPDLNLAPVSLQHRFVMCGGVRGNDEDMLDVPGNSHTIAAYDFGKKDNCLYIGCNMFFVVWF